VVFFATVLIPFSILFGSLKICEWSILFYNISITLQ
jgi:hypothetical protein